MSYDLQSGQVIRSPRGLLTGGLGGSDRQSTGGMGGMERFKFSPTGEMLAVGGRRGYVHLVDWGNGGIGNGGQVVAQVKMNVAVKGIAWQKGGKELVTLGEDSEVYVWDVGTRKCITRWRDDGGFGANGIETDRNEKFTAVA
jgi:U3 small nucleolar RNA-associated protein 18